MEYSLILGVGAATGIAATHFCGGDFAINGIFGALGAASLYALYVALPPLAFGVTLFLGVQGTFSAIQEVEVNGPNQCSGFKAVSSLLMVAIGARGLVAGDVNFVNNNLQESGGISPFKGLEKQPYNTNRKVVLQGDDYLCSAACLDMMLGRRDVSMTDLYFEMVKNNVFGDIAYYPKLLEQYGVYGYSYENVSTGMNLKLLQSSLDNGPAAVSVGPPKQGHAVVVDSIENGWVAIRDPLEGPFKIRLVDFLEIWRNAKAVVRK